MESYGSYETEREVFRTQGAVVFSAHKKGEKAAGRYAVKVFHLEQSLEADPQTLAALAPLLQGFNEAFESRVSVQRKAAEVSPWVSPVYESGTDERGSWYVTDFFHQSVNKIIVGRVNLGREGVFHVIDSIVRGALALKRVCGRSHGDLKPTNVLVSRGDKIKATRVVVSDPLPGDATEAARYELADLRAIGQILYQLVRRRAIGDAAEWLVLPIESSQEWSALFGKEALAWRELCGRLLDSNLSLDTYSLEQLEQDLARLKTKPVVSAKVVALGVAVLVIGCGTGFWLWYQSQRGTLLLTSDPPGADITINGQPQGTTPPDGQPLRRTFPRGASLTVTARYGELEERSTNVVVPGGKSLSLLLALEYATVVVNSDPAGAEVQIGDPPYPRTPFTNRFLRPGQTVTYRLDHGERYALTDRVVTVPPRGQTSSIAVTLQPMLVQAGDGTVDFTSNLGSVPFAVYLNGQFFTNAPARFPYRVGRYTFTAKHEDLPDQTKVAEVTTGHTIVRFEFPFGLVMVDSIPTNATVFAGTNRFVTPAVRRWPTGEVVFEFRKEGFESVSIRTNIAMDGRYTLRPSLVPTDAILRLAIEPKPDQVVVRDVRLQTRFEMTNNFEQITLPPGQYSVHVQADGYLDTNRTVELSFKEQRTLSLKLQRVTVPGVELRSDPPGAEFYHETEGRSLDSTQPLTLPWGEHLISARHRHYQLDPVTNTITVSRKGPNLHTITFSYGTLTLTSQPPGALIFERGKMDQPLGKAPTSFILRQGPREYVLKSDKGGETNVSVNVTTGTNFAGASFYFPEESLPNHLGMEFVWFPNESYGAVWPGKSERGFWVGRYEVTQKEYEQVMGNNPSAIKAAGARLPVESVNWNEAMEFCRRLTKTNRASMPEGWEFTLPTVSEWRSFAGRAFSDRNLAVIQTNRPSPVGSLNPNEFGLHDVRGNVWEWTRDNASIGGGFNSRGLSTSLWSQPDQPADIRSDSLGFRVIVVPSPGAVTRK